MHMFPKIFLLSSNVTNFVAFVGLEFERSRLQKRLVKELEKGLLVDPLVEISNSLVDQIETTLMRLDHVVLGGNM